VASEPVAPGAFCPWSRATRSSGINSSTQTGTQNGVGSWDCPSTVNELHQTLPITRETTNLSNFTVALSSPSPCSNGALHLWSLVFGRIVYTSFRRSCVQFSRFRAAKRISERAATQTRKHKRCRRNGHLAFGIWIFTGCICASYTLDCCRSASSLLLFRSMQHCTNCCCWFVFVVGNARAGFLLRWGSAAIE